MKADTRTIRDIFQGDRRFVVPVYQRPYVWNQEKQWEPLWGDIEATARRLAETRIDGHKKGIEAAKADQSAAPHFLGAVVIEARAVMTGDVDTRLVVDGQQRLTTLQLLLRGVLDALEEVEVSNKTKAQVRRLVMNDVEVVREDEILKLAPRRAEEDQFRLAMGAKPPSADESKFADARGFFRQNAMDFLADDSVPEDPYTPDGGPDARASLLVAALLGLMKIVVIDLEDVDDAQVIFEALNARNTPLSATDLVKNLLFMRAEKQDHDSEGLYESLWKRFDDDSAWWLESVGTGHAQRARQDWLLGDWLIAQRGRSINVGRLYGEFRRWLDDSKADPRDALSTLNQYADAYEAFNNRRRGASPRESEAFKLIERLNITAVMPLMLWLLVQPADHLPPAERERAVLAIESFVIRRMAAKYQTRAYGQIFVDVLKEAKAASEHPGQAVIEALRKRSGYGWPRFEDLTQAFMENRYYGSGGLGQDRLRILLGAIDRSLQSESPKSENITVDYTSLEIEHILPQEWHKSWSVKIDDPAARMRAEERRQQSVNRIGNLTLVTKHLNPALSNSAWQVKRAELGKHSKLQLNARLQAYTDWDEDRIEERGRWLAEQMEKVWPGPTAKIWG